MNKKEIEERIIKSYQDDEKMMVLIFSQWCINHELDPKALYEEAYPGQLKNEALIEMLDLTVDKQDSEEIPDETVINALQLFGNDDLAYIVQEMIDEREKNREKAED